MAGDKKKLNYPKQYHIRINEKLFDRLKQLGSKKVREYLERLH